MVKRIDKLTEAQEAALGPWIQSKVNLSLSTEPVDEQKFVEAARACYKFAELPDADLKFTWAPSPWAGALTVSILTNQQLCSAMLKQISSGKVNKKPKKFASESVRAAFVCALEVLAPDVQDAVKYLDLPSLFANKNELKLQDWTNYFSGYLWLSWPTYERFWVEVCGLELDGDLNERGRMYAQMFENSGWFWLFDKFVVASRKHVLVKTDAQNRLHSEHGPALRWSDGFSRYALQGTEIPAEWVTQPKGSDIDPRIALVHPNVEQRRVLRDMLGWSRVLEACNVKTIHRDKDPFIGELLEADLQDDDGRKARFLKALCGTGRTIVERVDPTWGDTTLEVQEKRWGVQPGMYKPEFRT